LLYPRLEAYIRPLGNLGVFYLFPTVAYVFIGTFVGAVIAARREAGAERRFHALLGIAGVVLLLAGWAGSYLPPISSRSEFYTTSISLVVIRAGAMTAALAAAWLWMRRPTAGHWSPLVLFGRASLFVYLVHVPLAYGAFSSPLHYALSLPAALAAYGLLTAVMLALAAWWPTRNKTEWIPARLRADWAPHQP
jgi:peptidoglycan/LPS O-acetylase OafA/YrhL